MLQEVKQDFNSRFDEMKQDFDEMKQRVKTSREYLDRSLDRLQHVMQQSSLAAEARANRKKTVEREEDAAMNWGKEDT